jgi:hypothetical protein
VAGKAIPTYSAGTDVNNRILTASGSNTIIGESTLTYDSVARILTVDPGNTSPMLGSARLGMANFAQGMSSEWDYLYSGHIVLGGGSSLAQYAMGTASKSYRGTNGTYTYTHMVVTDTGGFYTKYSANASDAAAAAGGTWRTYPSMSNGADNRVLTATGANTITGEAGLRYNGTQLDVSGNIISAGNIQLSDSSERVISLADSGLTGGTLKIRGAAGGLLDGGDLVLETQGGAGNGGDIIIRPGTGGGGHGNLYLNGDNSGYYGDAIYFYAGSATDERLVLANSALQSSVPIRFFAGDGYILQLGNDTDTGFYWNNSSRYLYLVDDSTQKFRFAIDTGQFDADGDIVGYSTAVSDIRLKENIEELESPLQKILQVRGISYDRKKTGERHIGVIAQEIEKVIPEVVVETTLPLETGDDQTLYKTVRYTEIIPYLIESIKEQQKMIEDLRNEINQLKK